MPPCFPGPGEAGLATVLTYEKLFENGLPDVENIQPVIRQEHQLWSPHVGQALKNAFAEGVLPQRFSASR